MTAATTAESRSGDGLSADKTDVGSGAASRDDAEPKHSPGDAGDNPGYPKGLKLVLIIVALCLAVFLVALDQTIIAPALGAITAHFQSVNGIVRRARRLAERNRC